MRQWYRDLGVALWTRAANIVHKCHGTNLPDDPDYTPPWEISDKSDDDDETNDDQNNNTDHDW
eukprot:2543932-Heterocapsa_arctica.AAC.1